jgi:predicted nucleic acid-binding protein
MAAEHRRGLDALPDDLEVTVSIVTIAELRLGVLRAETLDQRVARLQTLTEALVLDVIPIDVETADRFAEIVARLRDAGAKVPIRDTWIAASAVRHRAAVATQDADFERFAPLGVTILPA